MSTISAGLLSVDTLTVTGTQSGAVTATNLSIGTLALNNLTVAGVATVATAAAGTNTTQAASTAFVNAEAVRATAAEALLAPKASPVFTGSLSAANGNMTVDVSGNVNVVGNLNVVKILTVPDIILGTANDYKLNGVTLQQVIGNMQELIEKTEQIAQEANLDSTDETTWERISKGRTYDYIVVGSGAGGGHCALQLASNGFATKRVLMIEQGRKLYSFDTLIDPQGEDNAKNNLITTTKGVQVNLDYPILAIPTNCPVCQEVYDLFNRHVDSSGIIYPYTIATNKNVILSKVLGGGTALNGGVIHMPDNKYMKKYLPGVDLVEFEESRSSVHYLTAGNLTKQYNDLPYQNEVFDTIDRCGFSTKNMFDGSGIPYLDASGNDSWGLTNPKLLYSGVWSGQNYVSSESPVLGKNICTQTYRPTKLGWSKRVTSVDGIMYYKSNNLDMLFNTTVERINFDSSKNAISVTVIRDNITSDILLTPSYTNYSSTGVPSQTKSEVIIAGGVYFSPVLLEKSGIGRDGSGGRIAYNSVYTNNNVGENFFDDLQVKLPPTTVKCTDMPSSMKVSTYESIGNLCGYDNRELPDPDSSGNTIPPLFLQAMLYKRVGTWNGFLFNYGANYTNFKKWYKNGLYLNTPNYKLPISVLEAAQKWRLRTNPAWTFDIDGLNNQYHGYTDYITDVYNNAFNENTSYLQLDYTVSVHGNGKGYVHWDSSNNCFDISVAWWNNWNDIVAFAKQCWKCYNAIYLSPRTGIMSRIPPLAELLNASSGVKAATLNNVADLITLPNGNLIYNKSGVSKTYNDFSLTAEVQTLDFWCRYVIRNMMDSIHFGGTCVAAPEINGGVVDPVTFEVYGVKGVRCCSSEIIPSLTGSNSHAFYTTMGNYIGRKILDFKTGV
jgi:choline dehydrogenase-like flavoprotein